MPRILEHRILEAFCLCALLLGSRDWFLGVEDYFLIRSSFKFIIRVDISLYAPIDP